MAEHEEHKDEHGGGGGGHGGGGHGPGGGGHEEGHEGAPEWLISFADNVALMMGFFVILLAMNMQKPSAGGIGGEAKMGGSPTEQMLDFVIAMRKEFNNPIDLNSDNPAEAPFRKRMREKKAAGDSNQSGEQGSEKEAQAIIPTDFTNGGGTIQFEDDSSALSERARAMVGEIATQIAGGRFYIEVRGHASPHEAMLNWDKATALSHARSVAVAKELAARGVPMSHLRLVTCADNELRTSREQAFDPEQDQRNQRVEIIVTGQPVTGAGAQVLPEKSDRAGPKSGAGSSDDEHSSTSHRD